MVPASVESAVLRWGSWQLRLPRALLSQHPPHIAAPLLAGSSRTEQLSLLHAMNMCALHMGKTLLGLRGQPCNDHLAGHSPSSKTPSCHQICKCFHSRHSYLEKIMVLLTQAGGDCCAAQHGGHKCSTPLQRKIFVICFL